MCDTETHFDNSNYSVSEKMLIEDQRIASLRYLAFWSNPAWFRTTKHASLPDSAIKEWVTYHRLSVAVKKETMVQIIRSVKEVIPNSRLAKYGDFSTPNNWNLSRNYQSYDIDFEDMCCIAEDLNPRSHILKANLSAYARRYDFWGSEKETNISDTRDNDLNPASNRSNGTDFNHRIRSLNDWLKELNRVLMEVRQISNEAQLLDSWTDTLLKFCLRFVCILRNNENLVKLLNSEIAFIIDYEWLRKIPTSKIEVQSIPQPEENEDNHILNNASVDDLWLKLSSSSVRNIWKKEMKVPSFFDNESQRNKHLVPLMKNNFLRSRQSKILCSPRKTTDFSIEIPKNMETELLGSLLSIINENTGDAFIEAGDAAKNYFPEAHGEWTKHLFPHRDNLNTRFDKKSTLLKPRDVVPSFKDCDTKVKLQNRCSEIAALPIQFYKSVPPPTLAARFYMNCQPRNRVVFRPPNSLTSNPPNHQVHYNVPTAPVSNIQPPVQPYVPQTLLSKHCRIRQRLSAPTVKAPGRYHKLNILRAHYQHYNSEGTKEPQKYPSKTDENSCEEKISIENEANDFNDAKHECNNAETIALCDIPLPTTAPLVQLSHGYNIPFRIQQNVGNAIADPNKMSQSIFSNPELQARESRMPLRMNYPIKSVRLQTPMIKMTPPPRNHCIFPQFATKPRFLGPVTVNGLKQIQERLFQQRHQYDYTNNRSQQDLEKSLSFENISSHLNVISTGYEDKVEKWLKSINKHLKSGSYINLEELPEFPSVELPEFSSTKLTELSRVESTEHPSAELTKLPSVKLPNLSGIELPEPAIAEVAEVSNVELPKLTRVELPALSSINLSERPRIESPDIYNESYDGEKGNSEESEKSVDEAPELTKSDKFSGDHIKSNSNTLSNTMIGKSCKSKANILKLKKLKARREFFEHLQQLPDIVPKLKSCKSVKRKIKILNKYFAAINSISTGRFPFKNFIKVLGKKNQPIRNVNQTKNKQFSALKQECCLGKKCDKLSTESNFDVCQSNLLINDISKYKMWIRESQEFNAFPSKRMKLGKSQSSFLQTKTLIRDEQDRWISSLNYFDSIIDELFFADNGIEKILHRSQNKMMDAETNGWTHFKVAVKTIMRNIISSLNAKIS